MHDAEIGVEVNLRRGALLLGLLLPLCFVGGCTGPGAARPVFGIVPGFGSDPITQDPTSIDATHPARLVETRIGDVGQRMNALVYEAQGAGPHPTVLLLHGFPGNEKNLDLAQAIRRAGWNVVFFHYRGAWGSEGQFTFGHVLEDVGRVLDAIVEPTFATAHRIDPTRLTLIGHSMGGFAALTVGAEREDVDCVASIAGANFGATAKGLVESPALAFRMAMFLEAGSGPLNAPAGGQLVAELVVEQDRFDVTQRAGALASKPVLLIAGGRDAVAPADAHHTPLVRALEAAGAGSLESAILPHADHAFSSARIELARRVVSWLAKDCAAAAI